MVSVMLARHRHNSMLAISWLSLLTDQLYSLDYMDNLFPANLPLSAKMLRYNTLSLTLLATFVDQIFQGLAATIA